MDFRLTGVENYGYGFVPQEFLPPGRDEYWQRNLQTDARGFRPLRPEEIAALEKNRNICPNWGDFLVSDPFDPALIRDCEFYGLVRLGPLHSAALQHHDFRIPVGIRSSTIISSDVGADCAIRDCAYLSHYIIKDRVILSRIDEMQCTNHAKFGNGVLAPGEAEELRIWIDVMNEAGGRSVLPFAGMIPADAFLWAAYRDDPSLAGRLADITQAEYAAPRGRYGVVGSGAVIKSCRVIKDVEVGEYAYIKGANKLKNLTVHSNEDEATQIGEGVELVNGIIGCGCHIFYGVKAVRFVTGKNCNLKYGARLIHSVLGDNSTVSCCEILNNLIFPVHEQHHNNSFLIASLVQGQSNMAAGATIGSNHNSRANDGEFRAARGFWPGLAVTLKHPSRFASFVLVSKGSYPHELDIPFPFSLVNNNGAKNRLEVMPAYFWLYNLYALERNSWKAQARDRRKNPIQHIETGYLAPDTVEEIIAARGILAPLIEAGGPVWVRGLEKRPCRILKARQAYTAYGAMLEYYVCRTLTQFILKNDNDEVQKILQAKSNSPRITDWTNMGGQIVPSFRVDKLRGEINSGKINTWREIHAVYEAWAAAYPADKLQHALAVIPLLDAPLPSSSEGILHRTLEIETWIADEVLRCREKDYRAPFRSLTFRNKQEQEAVLGKPEEAQFLKIVKKNLEIFKKSVEEFIKP